MTNGLHGPSKFPLEREAWGGGSGAHSEPAVAAKRPCPGQEYIFTHSQAEHEVRAGQRAVASLRGQKRILFVHSDPNLHLLI